MSRAVQVATSGPRIGRSRVALRSVRGVWADAAAAERSDAANRHLALLLALIAGVLNSVGFTAVGLYTSHMTGLVASAADHLTVQAWSIMAVDATAVASFVAGAAACALVFNWGRRRHRDARYANVLALEALLILVIGATADHVTWRHHAWVDVIGLCFTMGLQNAVITKISRAQIRTTHVTGMITDIGIELGKLAYRNRSRHLPPVVGDLAKLRMLASLVTAFFVGGILGATGYSTFGFSVLLAPAAVLATAAAPPILSDRRS